MIWDRLTKIDQPVLMMDDRVSKDKYLGRLLDWENLSILDEIASEIAHKNEDIDQ